jgi:threonine dehydrogenase-like Zn-dependent dehydrogenase
VYTKPRAIVCVDVHDGRLKKALDLGATHVVNAEKEDMVAAIMRITDGQGVSAVVETSGQDTAIKASWKSLSPYGKVLFPCKHSSAIGMAYVSGRDSTAVPDRQSRHGSKFELDVP